MRVALRHVLILVAAAGAFGGAWLTYPYLLSPPPVPDNMDEVDEEVRRAIESAAMSVRRRLYSDSSLAHLGLIYHANAMEDLALQCYESAARNGSSDAKLWYRIALLRDKAGDTAGAIDAMRQAERLNDDYAPIRWRLGRWLLAAGSIEEAADSFDAATTIDPSDPAGWAGIALLELTTGRHEQAIEVARTRLWRPSTRPFAHHVLALAYQRQGDLDSARSFAAISSPNQHWSDPWSEEVADHSTRGFAARRRLAEQMIAEGKFQAAIPVLEGLITERPNDAKMLGDLGIACIETGRAADGREALQRAVDVEPGNPRVLANYANALLLTARDGTDDLSTALRHCETAISRWPASGGVRLLRADILSAANRKAEAITGYKQAFDADSRSPLALIRAGRLEVEIRRYPQAIETFERALEVDPGNFDAHIGLSTTLAMENRFEEAHAVLDRAEPRTDAQQDDKHRLRQIIENLRARFRNSEATRRAPQPVGRDASP